MEQQRTPIPCSWPLNFTGTRFYPVLIPWMASCRTLHVASRAPFATYCKSITSGVLRLVKFIALSMVSRPKCTRNIPVVECISMQSSAIKVKNFPFKVSVKFYGHYILADEQAMASAIADFVSLRCRQRSRLSTFYINYVAIHI